jgi:hypothetical protein
MAINMITTACFSSVPLATTTWRRRSSWIQLSEVQTRHRHREKERGESGKNEASSTQIQYHNLIRPSSPPDTTKWPSPHTLTALASPQCAHANPAPHAGTPFSAIPPPLAPAAPPAADASPPPTACSAAGWRVLSISTRTCNALPALVSFLHVLVTTGCSRVWLRMRNRERAYMCPCRSSIPAKEIKDQTLPCSMLVSESCRAARPCLMCLPARSPRFHRAERSSKHRFQLLMTPPSEAVGCVRVGGLRLSLACA